LAANIAVVVDSTNEAFVTIPPAIIVFNGKAAVALRKGGNL
jgi:hypothetical protein